MSARVSFISRFMAVALPTKTQGLVAVAAAIIILVASRAQQVLAYLGLANPGLNNAALDASRIQLHDRFELVATSQIASNLALVTFWASVGLIAYLVCWSAYNVIIEARNEVTLETQYTNRGHWKGPLETLGLKAACAVGLIIVVSLSKSGLAFWLALAFPVLSDPTWQNIAAALGAVVGLAVQLYLILALALLTFTPWYREETFTDQ